MNEMILWITAAASSAFLGMLLGYFWKEKRHQRSMQAMFNEFIERNAKNSRSLSEARQELARVNNNFTTLAEEHKCLVQDKRDLIDALHRSKYNHECQRDIAASYWRELNDLDSDHNKRMRTRGARAQAKKMRVKHAKELANVRMECLSFENMAKRYARRFNTYKGTVHGVLLTKVKLPAVREKLLTEIDAKYDENTREELMQ